LPTRITEDDLGDHARGVRRDEVAPGRPDHDNRKFPAALHYSTVRNLTWRALPSEHGNSNSVWKRSWRIVAWGYSRRSSRCWPKPARPRTWSRCSTAPWCGRMSQPPVQKGAGKREQDGQALGRSRGGFSSKLHLDIGPDITPRAAMTDKGYDFKPNRAACRKRGVVPVIPHWTNARDCLLSSQRRSTKGARIKQCAGKLERFKRVALRCEKTAESYSALFAFACTIILVKSVHTA